MKFKLLVGRWSPKGKDAPLFKKGDVVESKDDLVRLFGSDKFRVVDEPLSPIPPPVGQEAASPGAAVPPTPGVPPIPTNSSTSSQESSAGKTGSPFGEEVSDKFTGLKEFGLKVFHNEHGEYNVTDATDPTTSVNDDKKLTSIAKTQAFIDEFNKK